MTKPRELAQRCEDLFMAASLRSESDPPYGPEVWEGVLKTLETAPTLEAFHATLLFRDRLVVDEDSRGREEDPRPPGDAAGSRPRSPSLPRRADGDVAIGAGVPLASASGRGARSASGRGAAKSRRGWDRGRARLDSESGHLGALESRIPARARRLSTDVVR